MIDIPCIIFAGGKSSRMGKDKALLPFGGYPTLTQYQLHKLQKIFTHVYVSCKDKNKFDFEANFIEDIQTENIYAPTVGFVSIYQKLKCKRFFVISVDTPFVNQDTIELLIENDSFSRDATVASFNSQAQGMIGIYHASLKNSFEDMLINNNHKLRYLLAHSNTNYVNISDDKSFLNLNNPDEYLEALTLA